MKKWVIILFFFFLSACGSSEKSDQSTQQEEIEVKAKPFSTTLFYSGIVQPFKTVVVTSPAEGVIQETMFHYGDVVKAGQLLFSVSSEKFQTDYKAALMQFLKSKNEFETSQAQLKEGEFLHKNELISDDDFKSKKTSYYNAQLSFIQAQDALTAMIKKIDMKGLSVHDLSIENIEKINQVLRAQSENQKLQITAPVAGVILLPMKSDSDGETKKISKGDPVKQGDVIAVIGDVNGLTIRVNVNEFNINQIKIGQKVKVSGPAFSNFILEGEIAGVDRQAQTQGGGMPAFPVEIVVPKMTSEQQAIIHAGMSAKVEIQIEGEPKITVPIQAVFEKKGVAYVKVKDSKNGKIKDVAVRTGQTTEDAVVIEANLKEGDHVVFSR